MIVIAKLDTCCLSQVNRFLVYEAVTEAGQLKRQPQTLQHQHNAYLLSVHEHSLSCCVGLAIVIGHIPVLC